MDKDVIRNDTLKLLEYNKDLLGIYSNIVKEGTAADFYAVVKPFADQIFVLTERWKENVNVWIRKEHPKYLHPNQIENTIENITTVAVQAFFPDTRPKRFKELIRSNQYILESILQKLNE